MTLTEKGYEVLNVTPSKLKKFFSVFSVCGVIGTACKASNISRSRIDQLRKEDPSFAVRFAEAREMAADVLEQAAFKRAVTGVVVSSEPIVNEFGQKVGDRVTKKYSDTLLHVLLKANRPEKFKDALELNVSWRQEAKAMGINPEDYLQGMIDQARQQLEANADIIDVTPLLELEADNDIAARAAPKRPLDGSGN